MSFLNGAVVKAIATLRATNGDAELTVGETPIVRTLFIRKGELVGGFSNDPEERIGTLVAQSKALAPELIEAIAKGAAVKGKMLGDALIAEGLLSPTELVGLLEKQTLGRFGKTLTMPGAVRIKQFSTMRGVVRKPIGVLLVATFRETLPVGVIETLGLFAAGTAYALNCKESDLNELGLTPHETRAVRRLAQGESLNQLSTGPQGEQTMRVVLALIALGALRAKP